MMYLVALFRLGFRNLSRNTRRTVLSLLIMAGGFVAVVTFRGFAEDILNATRWGAVNSQYGHIQVAKKKLWEQDSDDTPADRQLDRVDELKRKVAQIPQVVSVAARLSLYGLASTGEKSVAAQLIGFEPDLEKEILTAETVIQGQLGALSQSNESVQFVAVGEGLAKSMKAKIGDPVTLIAQTADGAINAVDAEVGQIVRTVIQEIDDTTIYLPLPLAQRLTDSAGAERLIIKLQEHDQVPTVLEQVAATLRSDEQAKSWLELARLYVQTSEFFNTQNMVVSIIIFSLIFLATMSTVSMAVSERIGEIGTARALGWTSQDIIRLFAIEGLIQGVLGSLLGLILGYIVLTLVNQSHIPLILPGATEPIPIRIVFLPTAYMVAAASTAFAALTASVLSARRATRMSVVDCLKYNV